jgi:hypothetical protein
VLSIIAFLLIPLFVIPVICYYEGTIHLEGDGKGLLDRHYGFPAFALTTPAIFIILVHTLRVCTNILDNIHLFVSTSTVPEDIQRLSLHHLKSLSLRTKSRYILYLFHIFGLLFSIINVRQTINPTSVFGHDVFDSYQHPYGFIATRLFLAFLFSYLYPVAIFIVLHVTVSTVIVLRKLGVNDLLKVDLFSQDGSVGLSKFGKLNLLVMMVYFCFYLVMLGLFLTHIRTYATLNYPLLLSSLTFLMHNAVFIYYIANSIKKAKNKYLLMLEEKIQQCLCVGHDYSCALSSLLFIRSEVMSVRLLPYSRYIGWCSSVLRFGPPIIALLSHYRMLSS